MRRPYGAPTALGRVRVACVYVAAALAWMLLRGRGDPGGGRATVRLMAGVLLLVATEPIVDALIVDGLPRLLPRLP